MAALKHFFPRPSRSFLLRQLLASAHPDAKHLPVHLGGDFITLLSPVAVVTNHLERQLLFTLGRPMVQFAFEVPRFIDLIFQAVPLQHGQQRTSCFVKTVVEVDCANQGF